MRRCFHFLVTPGQRLLAALLLACTAVPSAAVAQQGVGWLRYAIPPDPPRYHGLPHAVVLLGDAAGNIAPEEQTAADELDRGLGHMVAGTDVVLRRFDLGQDAIILGTTDALHRARLGRHLRGWTEKPLPEEGFRIVHLRRGIREWYVLQGGSPRAVLWAAFRFAALVAEDQQLPQEVLEAPQLRLRALDMGSAAALLPLLHQAQPGVPGTGSSVSQGGSGFARLLASVGLNGIVVDASADQAAQLTELVQPYGLRIWRRDTGEAVPTLSAAGGMVVAVPPSATAPDVQAALDRANALARSLRQAGGTVLLEGALDPAFQQPGLIAGANRPTVQERAEVLRGAREPNVVLVSEAMPRLQPLLPFASPNFGLLPGSPQAAVLQVLPTGPQTLAFPAAVWASALHTPEHGTRGDTTLAALLAAGDAGGMVGRLTAADAVRMLQQPLLHANLYAFGRLAWTPTLAPEAIADEWARQTWGDDARVFGVAQHILLASAGAATAVSAPLGLPWLTDAAGNPDPAGMLHLYLAGEAVASAAAIGTDRSRGGTRETALYPQPLAAALADPAASPQTLLLFARLPWRFAMPDGKLLAQHLYDAAFTGAAEADNAVDAWETTQGLLTPPRYATVHTFLARAAVHAEIAREITTEWLQRTGGVRDALGFVGSHPGRVEASQLQRTGYLAQRADAAAGADATVCTADCTATLPFRGTANVYRVTVGYQDAQHGGSSFTLLVNGEPKAEWNGADDAGQQAAATAQPALQQRFVVNGVRLQSGDVVSLRMHAVSSAPTALDFVEITRDPRWN